MSFWWVRKVCDRKDLESQSSNASILTVTNKDSQPMPIIAFDNTGSGKAVTYYRRGNIASIWIWKSS